MNKQNQSASNIRRILLTAQKGAVKVKETLSDALIASARHRETFGDCSLVAESLTVINALLPKSATIEKQAAHDWAIEKTGHTFFTRDNAVKAGKKTAEPVKVGADDKPFNFVSKELEATRLAASIKREAKSAERKAAKEQKEQKEQAAANELATLKKQVRPLAEMIRDMSLPELKALALSVAQEIEAREKRASNAETRREAVKAATARSVALRQATAAAAA